MEIKYLKDEKNEAEIQIGNLTVAEILRIYLSRDDDVSFVAWKRTNPNESPVLSIKTKNKTARKALNDAVSELDKELNKLLSDFKKAK